MSSYRSHESQVPRPEESLSLSGSTYPRGTKTSKPLSNIPQPARKQASPAPASLFSRNRQYSNEGAYTPRADAGERAPSAPQSSKAGGNSITREPSAGSRPFGFKSSKPATTIEKEKPRNVLRRKAPMDQRLGSVRSHAKSDMSETDEKPRMGAQGSLALLGGYKDPHSDSVLEDDFPQVPSIPAMYPGSSTENSRPTVPEFAGLKPQTSGKQNPPTPAISATVSSPSTRYSESPGPWSRGSTPTSMSSYSPGIVQTSKIGYRARQPSPTIARPGGTRRKVEVNQEPMPAETSRSLPVVRESVTSSSSNSTVWASETRDKDASIKKHKKLTPPPPSPPPRKSSTKFKSPKLKPVVHTAVDDIPVEPIPELAHLKSSTVSLARSDMPPVRPSREGTQDLGVRPSPVIQSNLSPMKISGHHRRSSSGSQPRLSQLYQKSNQSTTAISQPSRSLSRQPTPSPRELTTPTISKGPSKSPSRFGFLKRSKTSDDNSASVREPRPPRKGPAAGTGHEGYGKYAQRGRRPSIGTSSSRGRSTSTSGSGSQSVVSSSNDLDNFLRTRLEPVVISGGGKNASSSEIATSGSSQGSTSSQPSNSSAALSMGASRLLQLATQDSEASHGKNSALNDDVIASSTKLQSATRTLADRRSDRRTQNLEGTETLTRPSPINTHLLASPPLLNSHDTSLTSWPATDTTLPPGDETLSRVDSKESNPTAKTGHKLRWNFFQRSQAPERKDSTPEPELPHVTEMQATIARIPALRPVPHYAMIDSEADQSDMLESILHSIEDSPPKNSREEPVPPAISDPSIPILKRQHGHSVLLPSPPALPGVTERNQQDSPEVPLQSPNNESRPARLQQVGRIPRVVSRRDRQHVPATQSFSRPFVRADTSSGNDNSDEPPIFEVQTDQLPSRPFRQSVESEKAASAPPSDYRRILDPLANEDAFLTFPARKGSEVSTSNSSGVFSYNAITAVLPEPGSQPTEDEVWNEYDDLIDQVLSPSSPSRSSSSSARFIFHPSPPPPPDKPPNTRESPPVVDAPPTTSPTKTTSVVLPPPVPSAHSSASVRLRRSRIVSALHSSIAPSTPMSVTDLLAQYAEGNDDGAVQRQSSSSTGRASMRSSHTRNTSVTAAGSDDISRQRSSMMIDMAERDREGPLAQSNLRFGALMTSRWLSFGRVLFSPAHGEVQSHRQARILVLDGLGNDDWSFYCAETYPNATVYSLSQVTPPSFVRNRGNNPSVLQSPPNHRSIHHANIGSPFPFPKGFFTVVIFRFPSATSDAALRGAIGECRRVLRPGGYIEISVLDIDMLNMGNRTRRAVRDLRVRMSVADPDVSLKPAGDNMQRMLGRRGFENLNRCMVSIPVAGKIGTSDGGSETQSIDMKNASLNEMLHDPSPKGDAGITKMVSRVGRWWFTRCYEWGVLPDDDLGRSMWADRAIIRECERMETGFRLLVAYAQKPDDMVRRTVSV